MFGKASEQKENEEEKVMDLEKALSMIDKNDPKAHFK